MRGIRYVSVMVVGLLVAPVALHAQANQNGMCAVMMQALLKRGKVVTPQAAPADKASGTDSAAKSSSGSTNGSAVADSGKIAVLKPGESLTCSLGSSPGAATDSAAIKTGVADSTSHDNTADTTKVAGAKKP